MDTVVSREIHLVRRPVGEPSPEDFSIESKQVELPAEGKVRVRNLWMSVDPYMANRLYEGDNYAEPYALGRPLDGAAIGVVIDSADPALAPGDLVSSYYGWREFYVAKGRHLKKLDKGDLPVEAFLGHAGVTGMTAYVGLAVIGKLQPGEVVYISAAAGAVGSAACQMAKLMGATVIGSARGPEKCRYLTEIGVDVAIDYTAGPLDRALQEAAPEGIDLYFDNVGGPQLEAAFTAMKDFGRVAVCGMISQYAGSDAPSPRNMFQIVAKRLTITGFMVMDHLEALRNFDTDVRNWIAEGKLRPQETVEIGIENAVNAFFKLFRGENTGKMLVRLSDL